MNDEKLQNVENPYVNCCFKVKNSKIICVEFLRKMNNGSIERLNKVASRFTLYIQWDETGVVYHGLIQLHHIIKCECRKQQIINLSHALNKNIHNMKEKGKAEKGHSPTLQWASSSYNISHLNNKNISLVCVLHCPLHLPHVSPTYYYSFPSINSTIFKEWYFLIQI